jgi:hypothetical protein
VTKPWLDDAGRDAFLFHSVDLPEIAIRGAGIFSTIKI